MNSEQLRLFINGAFGSEEDARKVRKFLTPYLQRSLDEIRQLVELLPDKSLARQREWEALLVQIEQILEPYNDAFAVELSRQLPISGAGAAEETTLMLKSVVPPTAGLVPSDLIMADSTKFLLNTKINNKRVLGLFIPTERGQASPFTKSTRRMIDQIVTGGIIQGQSTAKISRVLRNQLPQRMQAQSLALARTAIQDYNRQVKEEVWNANRDAFARLGLKYEWVSALDSRTCQTCAPLDGEERDKKGDFPKTPVHVNCRCQVVLIDPEDPGRVRYGQEALVQKPAGDGAYKTQKKVKGEELYRRNREVKTVDGKSPRYADFLASSNQKTQQMFFGGGNAGSIRAEQFRAAIERGDSPQKALINLTNKVDATAAKTTAKGVARRFKPVPDTRLGIGNPVRDEVEETLFLAPAAKVKAKGASTFKASTDSLDTSLANGRAVLKDVGGKDLPAIESAVDDYRSNFAAYKRNPADPKAKAKLEKALKDGAPAMERFIKRLEETPKGFKPPKLDVEIIDGDKKLTDQVNSTIGRHFKVFNGKNIGEQSLKKVVVDKSKPFLEAYYEGEKQTLFIGAKGKFVPEILHHEMAHALEVADPKVLKMAQAFRKGRAQHGGQSGMVKLSDEEFDVGMRYVDEWINGYIGMDYKGMGELFGAANPTDETEVISVGVEYLLKSPEAALELLARDPDHFSLILSLTRLK